MVTAKDSGSVDHGSRGRGVGLIVAAIVVSGILICATIIGVAVWKPRDPAKPDAVKSLVPTKKKYYVLGDTGVSEISYEDDAGNEIEYVDMKTGERHPGRPRQIMDHRLEPVASKKSDTKIDSRPPK
jgi:hypothetical protein